MVLSNLRANDAQRILPADFLQIRFYPSHLLSRLSHYGGERIFLNTLLVGGEHRANQRARVVGGREQSGLHASPQPSAWRAGARADPLTLDVASNAASFSCQESTSRIISLKGMRGLNKRFTDKPDQFLHEVALIESEELMKVDVHLKVPAGRHKFDLVPSFNGTAELRLAPSCRRECEL